MKNYLNKKTDRKTKVIKQEFIEILQKYENSVFKKVPEAIKSRNSSDEMQLTSCHKKNGHKQNIYYRIFICLTIICLYLIV